MPVLPIKLSELVELALDSVEELEKSPLYKIDMQTYHRWDSGLQKCRICLAGAVMVKVFAVSPRLTFAPDDFGYQSYKLTAVDYFRMGDPETASLRIMPEQYLEPEQRKALGDAGLIFMRDILGGELLDEPGPRFKWSTYREASKILQLVGL